MPPSPVAACTTRKPSKVSVSVSPSASDGSSSTSSKVFTLAGLSIARDDISGRNAVNFGCRHAFGLIGVAHDRARIAAWDREPDQGAAGLVCGRPNPAVMFFRDALDDRQPDA